MPALQKQTQAVESELHSLKMAAVEQAKYLQLAESLAGFRSKLRVRAEAVDIGVRQQILRLLVKEVLVGSARLHCAIRSRFHIPVPIPLRKSAPARSWLRSLFCARTVASTRPVSFSCRAVYHGNGLVQCIEDPHRTDCLCEMMSVQIVPQ